jgi:hypothetical protein
MHGLRLFTNDEKTRTFISLDVTQGRQQVVDTIKVVDSVLRSYGQPVYYTDPQPHATVASMLGDRMNTNIAEKLSARFNSEQAAAQKEGVEDAKAKSVQMMQLHCKIGNKLFRVPFPTLPAKSGGLY